LITNGRTGPVVFVDEGHHNFHTKSGRYRAFSDLLERDGYVVRSYAGEFEKSGLKEGKILVISNALHPFNDTNWYKPVLSASSPKEIKTVKKWVKQGAFRTYGKGKVVAFGEAAMFTAQLAGPNQIRMGMNNDAAPENYQLLMNIVHWLDGKLE